MYKFRARSSFLGFDKYFGSAEEIEAYVNSNFYEVFIKSTEIHNHFVDNNIPYFGVKGIIITKETDVNQQINIDRHDLLSDSL